MGVEAKRHIQEGRLERLLESARSLLEEAERSAREQRLIMSVGVELSASIDYSATLQKVARLVVSEFAEWCLVDVVEDGRVKDIAVAHQDPVKESLARSLVRKLPQLPSAPHGVARVLRTLEPELYSGGESTPNLSHRLGTAYPEALREIGARSYICAPLVARDRAIGAVTYVRGGNAPGYEPRDLELATELARWAAMAIENAMLHRKAEEAVRERDDLVAMLSHDLRGLVGNITLSATQAQREGEGTDPRWAERVRRAADRMMRLISDTLDVVRIERGAIELDRHDREAEAIVSDAIDAAWQSARAKEITIDHDVPSNLRVLCDPTRAFQVLLNLLDNAVKFSPERSRIVVTVRPTDGDACFSISDAGPGIPDDALPHVFDRFWQGRHQRRAGAGLGLAIVKGIVEAHGGRVWLESAEGKGTTFRFTLPLAGQEHSSHDLH